VTPRPGRQRRFDKQGRMLMQRRATQATSSLWSRAALRSAADAFPSRESAGRTASRARSPHLREVSADQNGRLTEPTQK
jgi:hypothetical protein